MMSFQNKIYPIAIVLFLCIGNTFGQDNLRPYEEGPLQISDFKGDLIEVDSLVGQIYFDAIPKKQKYTLDGITVELWLLQTVMNSRESWINYDLWSGHELFYFQVMFDIEYLYAEKYNNYVMDHFIENTGNYEDGKTMSIIKEKNIQIEKFLLESKNGTDSYIIDKWSQKIKKRIAELSRPDILDKEVSLTHNNGMGMSLGGGKFWNTDDLETHFGNLFHGNLGFEFYIKKHLIVFDMRITTGNMDASFTQYPFWTKDTPASQVMVHFGYGRKHKLHKNLTVGAFIGPALSNFYLNKDSYDGAYPNISNTKWNVGGGIFLDIPFRKFYGISPKMTGPRKAYHEWGIKISSGYIHDVAIYDRYNGSTYSLNLSLYMNFGSLEVDTK